VNRIPIYQPKLGNREKELVNDCLDSTWISSRGKYIDQFEQGIAEFTGAKHAIAVFNGTVALHLALLGLDIRPGDEVIVPDFTYVASTNAVLYVGATPIFVDVDAGSWNMDPALIERVITPRTKAILYTNVYGNPVDYHAIKEIADRHGLLVIEDAAESLGATYGKMKSGTMGDVSTFSFFGNKTLTTGEGGMVLTSDDGIAAKMRVLKNQGNSPDVRYYHDMLGYNYRMTNIQAAIGCAQLEQLDEILARKRSIQAYYESRLSGHFTFQKIEKDSASSYWIVSMLTASKAQKEELVQVLASANIETRPFFWPIDRLPFYQEGLFPVTQDIAFRGINLPSYPDLTEEQLNYICDQILTYLNKN
jgi:perosamine synthetase